MISPELSDEKRRLADDLTEQGKYAEARPIYSFLLRYAPRDPHLLALRGYTLYRLGDVTGALRDFDAALALKHDAPNTLFLRAKCNELLNDLDAAVSDYREVLNLAPGTADAHSGIAMICEYRGDLLGARREHQMAVRINPSLESSARFFRKYGGNPGE